MQSGLRAMVGNAPGLDAPAIGATKGEVFLHGGAFEDAVFDILDEFDGVIVEKFERIQSARRKMGPPPTQDPEADARVVSGQAVAEREGVEREGYRSLQSGVDGGVDVIDVFLAL